MHQVSNGQSYFSNDGAFVQRYRWNNGDETFKMYKKLGPNQKFVPATNSNRMLEETGTTTAPSHDGHDHDGHAHDDHKETPTTTQPSETTTQPAKTTAQPAATSHDGHDHEGHAHDDHNDAPKTTTQPTETSKPAATTTTPTQTSSFNASKYLPSYSIKLQKIGGYTAPSAANCPAQTGASMVTK